jgi:hypothetical protein
MNLTWKKSTKVKITGIDQDILNITGIVQFFVTWVRLNDLSVKGIDDGHTVTIYWKGLGPIGMDIRTGLCREF